MPTWRMAIDVVAVGAGHDPGRLRMPSVERIATWGWLMIGSVMNVPNGPGFVIVNVPPMISSG